MSRWILFGFTILLNIAGLLAFLIKERAKPAIVAGIILFAQIMLAVYLEVSSKKAPPSLVIYSAADQELNAELRRAFEEEAGINAEINRVESAVQFAEIIRRERTEPKADIFLGGSSDIHAALAQDGLLAEYHSSEEEGSSDTRFTASRTFISTTWKGCWWNLLVYVINDKLPHDIDTTKLTWDDLTNPKLRGQIALPDPTTTGGGFVYVATQVFRLQRDTQALRAFLQRVEQNRPSYESPSTSVVDRVGRGEAALGVTWLDNILRLRRQRGYQIRIGIPRDAGYEVGAVSIVLGARNLANAQRFVDFMLRDKAATIIARSYRYPLKRNASLLKLPPLTPLDASLVEYDHAEAGRHLRDWVNLWQRIRQGRSP